MEQPFHQPVMLGEAIAALAPKPGGRYVDVTLGLGGHARRILEESAPDGSLLGVERDPETLEHARANLAGFGQRLIPVCGRMSDLAGHLQRVGWERVDGLLADLGVSSVQLDDATRGFSLQQQGPLDMRMNRTRGMPLGALLDTMDIDRLADVLRQGEVRAPRVVARRILQARDAGRLGTTTDLARVAGDQPRHRGKNRARHPATRSFMALRILVNDELTELESLLRLLPSPLAVGGRAVFISFHSLEDRLVKQRLVELEGRCTCPAGLPACHCGARPLLRRLRRGVLRPSAEEVRDNPRARSARLRAAERVAA